MPGHFHVMQLTCSLFVNTTNYLYAVFVELLRDKLDTLCLKLDLEFQSVGNGIIDLTPRFQFYYFRSNEIRAISPRPKLFGAKFWTSFQSSLGAKKVAESLRDEKIIV